MKNKIYFLSLFLFILDRLIKKILFIKEEFLFFKLTPNPYFIFFFKGKIFYFLIPIVLFLLIFYIVKNYRQKEYLKMFSLILIFIGGLSNFFDHLFNGFVIDYFSFFNLLTLNLADLMIFAGLLFYFLKFVRIE
ncbi:MAG: signal peptidase II [Patescibacteria group bacterium]